MHSFQRNYLARREVIVVELAVDISNRIVSPTYSENAADGIASGRGRASQSRLLPQVCQLIAGRTQIAEGNRSMNCRR